MNVKLLRNVLFFAGISLLIASCGGDTPKEALKEGETPSALPKIPSALPDTLKVKRLSKTYVITGIGLSKSNKVAIINNQVVMMGVEIDPGVVLEDVQPTYAIILEGNTKHLLRPEDLQYELDKKNH